MDEKTKLYITAYFHEHFSDVYSERPNIKMVNETGHIYLTNPEENNIICLIPPLKD